MACQEDRCLSHPLSYLLTHIYMCLHTCSHMHVPPTPQEVAIGQRTYMALPSASWVGGVRMGLAWWGGPCGPQVDLEVLQPHRRTLGGRGSIHAIWTGCGSVTLPCDRRSGRPGPHMG